MKKRGLLKRIAALAMSAAMALGAGSAASAATIDGNAKGSLQIQKFQTGTAAGIKDVNFSYAKVGDFVLTNGNVSGFTITDNTLKGYLTADTLGTDRLSAIETGTPAVYDGSAIQKALNAAMANDQTKAGIKALATTPFTATDNSGSTNKVSDLPAGIYLVVETSAPAAVTKLSDPFIVSVPTLIETDGVQSWNYDVVAQPKNDYINTPPAPDKKIVENDEYKTETSAKIGDSVAFKISSTVPAVTGDSSLLIFDFIDTLGKGLTVTDTSIIRVEAKTGDDTDFTDITDTKDLYTVSVVPETNQGTATGNKIMTVSFVPEKVRTNHYKEIAVTYTATLNADAVVGNGGNVNEFEVQYTNDPTKNVEAQPVKVYTYGFTLQKQDENKAALAGAVFRLYDAETNGNAVRFYTEIDADEKVTGNPAEEVTAYDPAEDATETQKAAKGQASFYGLAAGDYYLEETKAPGGYNLLKSRVKVTVNADTTGEGVDITIVNTRGFTLPSTGGTGTVIFTVVGIVIMLGAAFMLIRTGKKNKE